MALLVLGSLTGVVLGSVPAGADSGLSSYTWTGASTTSPDWTDSGSWTSSSSPPSAPSGIVASLTFPDLAGTAVGSGTCDRAPSSPSSPPTCYQTVDNVPSGLTTGAIDLTDTNASSGPYYIVPLAGGSSPLTLGGVVGGPTTLTSTAANATIFEVPLALSSTTPSQSWSLTGGGMLDLGGGINGAATALSVDLAPSSGGAGPASTLGIGAPSELAGFTATGPAGDSGLRAPLGGMVTLTGRAADLNGQSGNPVDVTNVGLGGNGSLGDLVATGALVVAGSDGTGSAPGSLRAGAVSLDATSALQVFLTGPASGTSAVAGTDSSELVAAPITANAADSGTVQLGNATLLPLAGQVGPSGSAVCFTPTVGTTYTLVSAGAVQGQLDGPTGALADGSVIPLATPGSCGPLPVGLQINYDRTSSPETVTGTVVALPPTTGPTTGPTFPGTLPPLPPVPPVPGPPAPTPPTPTGLPPSDFGTPVSATTQAGTPTTLTDAAGGATASLVVPAGAFPAGTTVDLFPVSVPAPLAHAVPAGQAYVASFAVTWAVPGGGTASASVPLRLTIDDPAIAAGDTIYEVGPHGLVAVGRATTNGTATITFIADPVFLVVAVPRVALASARAVRAGRTLAVELACAGAPCRGTVEMTGAVTLQVRRHRHAIEVRRRGILGWDTFAMGAGRREFVRLRLSPLGRAALRTAQRQGRRETLLATVAGGRRVARIVLIGPDVPRHPHRG